MPSPPATQTVALYGGALHVDVPASYVDVSALREVPDHQEVYADAAATDACVIVELLSTPADSDSPSLIPAAAAPAAFHWRQLAADADAVAVALRREAPLPPGDMPAMLASVAAAKAAAQAAGGGGGGGGGARPFGGVPPAVDASVATGHHTVAKFREAASDANLVEVSVGCFRLPHVTTDLLVIVNDPLVIAPGSSSAAAGARGGGGGGAGGAFALALRTLRVDDWSLFCDD